MQEIRGQSWVRNSLQTSPEGTAENDPGRQSWVNLDRSERSGHPQNPTRFSFIPTRFHTIKDYLHAKPDLLANLDSSDAFAALTASPRSVVPQTSCASPGLQSGEAGFQTRENALPCNDPGFSPGENLPAAERQIPPRLAADVLFQVGR